MGVLDDFTNWFQSLLGIDDFGLSGLGSDLCSPGIGIAIIILGIIGIFTFKNKKDEEKL